MQSYITRHPSITLDTHFQIVEQEKHMGILSRALTALVTQIYVLPFYFLTIK